MSDAATSVPVEEPLRCSARSSRTGAPCKKWAIAGGTVCSVHGGRAPQVKAAAERRLVRAAVEGSIGELLERLGLDPAEVSYAEVLAEQVVTAHGMAAVIKHELADVNLAALHGPDHLNDARPHVLTTMLRDWTVEAARLSKLALDAGVDERHVRLAERQGERLVAIVEGVVAALCAAFVARGIEGGVAEVVRREDVPGIVRNVVNATASETPGEIEVGG